MPSQSPSAGADAGPAPQPLPPVPAARPYRSKTTAAWLALVGGSLGAHRLYLHGPRDGWAWLHPLPTLAGVVGLSRLLNLGQDDALAQLLIPLLGLMISLGMFTAIFYALTPDERWDARHNPGHAPVATAWGAVLAAVAGLLLGGGVLMGSITYGMQKFFEWQLRSPATGGVGLTVHPAASPSDAPSLAARWQHPPACSHRA